MADYPLPKFHFKVEWGEGGNTDEQDLRFTEVSGLDVEVEMIEYRDGNSPEYSKVKMPGMIKYSNVTLKRGMFQGLGSYGDWYNTIVLNKVERRTVTIKLLNEEHQPVVTWRLNNAWPVKIQSTDLKGDGNEVAIETMEIAHEGLTQEFV
nr:phage tail protein [uncultured Psychroserpens sp.]